MADRFNAYKTAIEAGWMDVNEVRAREALPPLIATPQPEPQEQPQGQETQNEA